MDALQVRYARTGDVNIAYQVIGSGAIDLMLIPGLFSDIDHHWEEPGFARFLRRLASFTRLIVVDPRGTGLSDRASQYLADTARSDPAASITARMSSICASMDSC